MQLALRKVKHVGICKEATTSVVNSPRDISEFSNPTESEVIYRHCPQERPNQPIYLPPTVLCMNPNCVCTHTNTNAYIQHIPINTNCQEMLHKKCDRERCTRRHRLSNFIGKLKRIRSEFREHKPLPMELYKMNIKQQNDGSPPRRFVFDLVDDIPKPDVHTVGTNTKTCSHKYVNINKSVKQNSAAKATQNNNSKYSGMIFTPSHVDQNFKLQSTEYYNCLEKNAKLHCKCKQDTTKVDVYYFDHGNAAYFRTTDSAPLIYTERMAEKTENYAIKFWAELFGVFYIAFAFITTFFLQLFRFILHSIIRPLTIGMIQLVSDYFFKPLLAVIFNSVIQPPLIFVYNIMTSLRDLCDPVAEGMGYFLREFAVLCRSIRLFEIRQEKANRTFCSSSPNKYESKENDETIKGDYS